MKTQSIACDFLAIFYMDFIQQKGAEVTEKTTL